MMMKHAFVLLFVSWFPRSGVASFCGPASYSIQDRALKNHTIKIQPMERIEDCIMQCMEHSGCHSSNFYRKSRACELNDKTHASHPEDMAFEPFSNYMMNTFRPISCNKHTDCGKYLVCLSTLTCGKCNDRALGMENNDIPNSAITASSTWQQNGHEPWRARLHNVPTSLSRGSWSTASNNVGEWLQIDLGKETVVTKIATQGRPTYFSQWVTSYKILYSSDNTNWKKYKENGSMKVFSGNSDDATVVLHVLSSKITARYVRFSIMSWNNHISMRAELYGCAYGP